MKLKLMLALLTPLCVGCQSRALDRLLHGPDKVQGEAYNPPKGDLSAQPLYDQSAASAAQDDRVIARLFGSPSDINFQTYIHEKWLPDWMNGHHNLANGSTGVSSILVDGWKALYRRGYVDISKLNDPNIIHTNVYPVPVYQDDRTRWGL